MLEQDGEGQPWLLDRKEKDNRRYPEAEKKATMTEKTNPFFTEANPKPPPLPPPTDEDGRFDGRSHTYAGESSKEKRCRIIDKTIFASSIAKFCPMHILGPHPNGKNETWPLVAFDTPSENLSGLNSFTSSPHNSRSWVPTQQHHSPNKQNRCGLLPCKVEKLAFLYHILNTHSNILIVSMFLNFLVIRLQKKGHTSSSTEASEDNIFSHLLTISLQLTETVGDFTLPRLAHFRAAYLGQININFNVGKSLKREEEEDSLVVKLDHLETQVITYVPYGSLGQEFQHTTSLSMEKVKGMRRQEDLQSKDGEIDIAY
ncbi:cytochrome P450 CYP72A219-like [Senna tora]|uniref:Cytochrome P450 CYP72A219-like n=1 Tax=Senna tora TaxID=362788 RepID=A0A834WMR9_9FABA|nr:cytochrome P450 CYP72A219-like [Senna tora]